jgi:hypothetical protein
MSAVETQIDNEPTSGRIKAAYRGQLWRCFEVRRLEEDPKTMNSDRLNSFSNPEIVCASFSLFSPLPFQINDANSAILDPHNSE